MATFNVIVQRDSEGWFVSEVVELPGCHTQARDIDQLMERTKEAITAYLASEQKEGTTKFVGVRQIEV